MLIEIARPVALLFCILSLYAVFHAAFLVPASDLHQKILESLTLLALSAGISLAGGLTFTEPTSENTDHPQGIMHTLPMQLFCWGTAIIAILFLLSWYLESFYVLYKDPRVWR